jgi:hypothetical protein
MDQDRDVRDNCVSTQGTCLPMGGLFLRVAHELASDRDPISSVEQIKGIGWMPWR